MLKTLFISFFISISLFTFSNNINGDFLITQDSVNNVSYNQDYIYFIEVVDIKIFSIKGSLIKQRRGDRIDITSLKPGIYIISFGYKNFLYLKQQ